MSDASDARISAVLGWLAMLNLLAVFDLPDPSTTHDSKNAYASLLFGAGIRIRSVSLSHRKES